MEEIREFLLEQLRLARTLPSGAMIYTQTATDKGPEGIPSCCMSQLRISLTMKGTLQQVISRGGRYEPVALAPGGAFLHRPFTRNYGLFHPAGCEYLGLILWEGMLRFIHATLPPTETSQAHPGLPPQYFYHLTDTLQPSTIDAFHLLFRFAERTPPPPNETIAGQLKILLELARTDLACSGRCTFGKEPDTWRQILQYINESFLGDISRDDVAARFQVSNGYVSRLFRRHTGITFNEYLTRLRLETAEKLLTATNRSIDEIAWQCAYRDTSWFIKAFKHCYRLSPGRFRERAHQHDVSQTEPALDNTGGQMNVLNPRISQIDFTADNKPPAH